MRTFNQTHLKTIRESSLSHERIAELMGLSKGIIRSIKSGINQPELRGIRLSESMIRTNFLTAFEKHKNAL